MPDTNDRFPFEGTKDIEVPYTQVKAGQIPAPQTLLVKQKPVPPGFLTRSHYEGFQDLVMNAVAEGMFPRGLTAKKAIMIALKAHELGLEPLYGLSVLFEVGGRVSLEGEAMLALVLKRYPSAQVRYLEQSNSKVVIEMSRPGGQPSQFSFTIEQAIQAGLVQEVKQDGTVVSSKDVWKKYTQDMLCWRAVVRGVRRLFPECIMGTYLPDEIDNIPKVKTTELASQLNSEFLSDAG